MAKRIRLTGWYQNANGVRIPPGDYDLTDVQLKGMGQYLVDTDQCEILTHEPNVTSPPLRESAIVVETNTDDELPDENWTNDQIRAWMDINGIEYSWNDRKADLLAHIENHAR